MKVVKFETIILILFLIFLGLTPYYLRYCRKYGFWIFDGFSCILSIFIVPILIVILIAIINKGEL